MSIIKTAAITGTLLAIAACQGNRELAGPPILNGSWASTDGVYVAQLNNGSFQAIANDTGAVISEGTYIALAQDRVQIDWVGNISKTTNRAECTKPEDNLMNCVDQNGNTFSLRRNA